MATSKNKSTQTGVEVSTTGSAAETGAETSGNAPVGTENSISGGGAIEPNETAGTDQTGTETAPETATETATEAGNAPEAGTEPATGDQTENASEGEANAQSEAEAAPVTMEDLTRKPKNLSEVPVGERPLAQHSEEVKVRNEAAQTTGGEETVATGIHKGRKIVNGAIDFSTASDREKTIAANKKTAKENLANETAEPAGEEKKAA